MNEIANFFKSLFDTIVNVLGGFLSVPLLIFAALLFLIGWMARPGKGLKAWNMPSITMVAMVLMVFFALQSLTVVTAFGWKTVDTTIVTLAALIIGLIWLANFYSTVGKIICYVLAVFVLGVFFTTGNTGPSDSILANFIQTVFGGARQLLGSLHLS